MSSSCSTTKTELPNSLRFLRILISRVVSSGCNPTLGSSNTYIEPTKALPRDVARLILWVSPPESVFDFLFNVKYERPTSLRKVNLLTISSIILLLFFLSDSERDNSLKNFKFFSIDISTKSRTDLSFILTLSASFLNLFPWQSLHFVRPL